MSNEVRLTAAHAAALAAIQASGQSEPVKTYHGYLKFYGFDPEAEVIPDSCLSLLRLGQTASTDPIFTRRVRLEKYPQIASVVQVFAEARNAQLGSALRYSASSPPTLLVAPDMLGRQPRDRAGQAVILRAIMTRHTSMLLLADAFSMPFHLLGERLLEGELIGMVDPPLAAMAQRAVLDAEGSTS